MSGAPLKILLIEDYPETAAHVEAGLSKGGHSVDRVADGREGLGLAMSQHFDLMIVDRMLPALDGLTLVKMIRAGEIGTPVLFLSALAGIDDKVVGLDAGGDDYLVKPFALAELLARVNALSRRPVAGGSPTILRAGDLKMDLVKRTVTRAGQKIDLQAREFELLEFLMRNAGKVITRSMLLEQVCSLRPEDHGRGNAYQSPEEQEGHGRHQCRSAETAKNPAEAGISSFIISIDAASREVHEDNRGPGVCERIREANAIIVGLKLHETASVTMSRLVDYEALPDFLSELGFTRSSSPIR